MAAKKVNLALSKDWIIPKEYLEQYAANIAFSKGYGGKIPSPPKEFFIQRLHGYHEEPIPEGTRAYNVMPLAGGKMVGWGHLSWSDKEVPESKPAGELFVYVIPEERRKGIGTKMCKALLEKLPADISCLETPALEEDSVHFSEARLGAVQVDETTRRLLSIEQVGRDNAKEQAEKCARWADEAGLEISLSVIETLEQDFDIPTLVRLKDQTLAEDQLEGAVQAFEAMLKRDLGREGIVWIATATETATGKVVGYSHSEFNTEGNQGTAFDQESHILNAHRSKDLYLALKSKILDHIITQTPATHWLSYDDGPDEASQKADQELGFRFFTTHRTYHIDRDAVDSLIS